MELKVEERIGKMREVMQKRGIEAVYIPSADPHQSEYLPSRWKTIEWLSGFTGSAGTLIVTSETAGLWTDSRYFIQGEEELKGTEITLHKMGEPGVLKPLAWLRENLKSGDRLFTDASCITTNVFRTFEKEMSKMDVEMVAGDDLFDEIWEDRPAVPMNPIYMHPEEFAIHSTQKKLKELQSNIKKDGAEMLLISMLDEVAWLTNLRGSDVECNPVFLAWMAVSTSGAELFIDQGKLSKGILHYLKECGIGLRSYNEIYSFAEELEPGTAVHLDPGAINYRLFLALEGVEKLEKKSPVCLMKAKKSKAEMAHIRNAMKRDGVAIFRSFEWLKNELKQRPVPESEFAEVIARFRSEQDHYVGESFHAIVGYKGNGAIVHYRAMKDTCADIEADGMLLVDSGGQYLDGTTDITRTIHLSEPTPSEKKHFTLVLKGMIGLSQAVFPEGTMGVQLDLLAREHLWKEGLDYGHGTGHGVGFFLNVHEPPQGFVPNLSERGTTKLREGMISSNEPGYYLQEKYGIRCENLVVCKKRNGNFLELETLTLMPFDKKLIDLSLMSPEEIKWLDDYHQRVLEELGPLLNESDREVLEEQCGALK
ncbi:MAG: aminopeptidase P family protein [Saprospirales bacterium]|nr:MAG: aminopeptidase P family protein [Saprospirales bacterium]